MRLCASPYPRILASPYPLITEKKLIAEAAHRMAGALRAVVAGHRRGIGFEVAAVSVTTATLGSTPEGGDVAGTAVAAVVVTARRQRTEARFCSH